MSEPRANTWLQACFMLIVGVIDVLIRTPLSPWFGIVFFTAGALHLLLAWRASDEALARLQRRWFIHPIEIWRVLRGK